MDALACLVLLIRQTKLHKLKIMSASTRKSPPAEILLFADTATDPDVLYFGGVQVPDAFIAFSHRGERHAVVSQLEFGRVSRESLFDKVHALEDLVAEARQQSGKSFHYPASVITLMARKLGIQRFRVSETFPCGTAFALQEAGVELEVATGMLLPKRGIKSDAEARCIAEGNAAAAAGFRVVERMLREASIRKGYLYHGKSRLTSERLQEAIAVACLSKGAIAANSIVAGGDQACDPHCRGSGPLRADSFIIVDIFPRVSSTGYHGDMTRTYLKGQPSPAQSALYETVFQAQQTALAEHRAGRSGKAIYKRVVKAFKQAGYETGRDNGVPVGFFHGLGHGLGLAVHEPPRVNATANKLRSGNVITVEPGLYYPGLGGVRVEDVIRVTRGEPEMLSSHPYRWHIR